MKYHWKGNRRFLLWIALLLTGTITGCLDDGGDEKEEEMSDGYPETPVGSAFVLTFDEGQFPSELFDEIDGQDYWASYIVAGRVSVSNGTIKFPNQSSEWNGQKLLTGAVVSTAFYGYGDYITRMKASPMPGVVTAFYLYNEDRDLSEGGTHEEIDIELSGHMLPGSASLVSYHHAPGGLDNDDGSDRIAGGVLDLRTISGLAGFNSTQFHTWKIEYRPDRIVWYVDDIEVYRVTRAIPTTRMQLHIDTYHSTDWDVFVVTPPSDSGVAEVDFVSFTPVP